MGDMVVADVKERPILFSGEMVRAILDGRKTQTRRVVKPQPEAGLRFVVERPAVGGSVAHFGYVDVGGVHHKELTVMCRHGQPGDRLWVRETFRFMDGPKAGYQLSYRAGGFSDWPLYHSPDNCYGRNVDPKDVNPTDELSVKVWPWRPSIFMPRWASRLTLEVVSVRVERVQEITEADAIAEGVQVAPGHMFRAFDDAGPMQPYTHRQAFGALWDSINGERAPWASNPWVWVVEFKRVTA